MGIATSARWKTRDTQVHLQEKESINTVKWILMNAKQGWQACSELTNHIRINTK